MNIGLGIGIPFTRSSLWASIFTPSALFLDGSTQGVWYDPSDINLTWRRNLLTYSEQFDNAAWTKSNSTVTPNATLAPDGTLTADKLVEDTANSTHQLSQIYSGWAASVSYVFSVYLAKDTRTKVIVLVTDNATGDCRTVVDLVAGTASNPVVTGNWSSATVSITPDRSGFYRVVLTVVKSASGNLSVVPVVGLYTTSNSYTGDGTSGIYIWGAQLEQGSTATPYQRITDGVQDYLQYQAQPVLYRDAAGTTPVTAVEQPVGLMLDKSKGLVLGSNLAPGNGEFNSAGGWTTDANWSISNGSANTLNAPVNSHLYSTEAVLTVGKIYLITFTISGATAGAVRPYAGSRAGSTYGIDGTYSLILDAAGSGVIRFFTVGVSTTISIDNVSYREIPGNHAFNSSGNSANFPVLSARYNLLTKTEDFSDAVWIKQAGTTVSSTKVAAPDGTLTAFSVTGNGTSGIYQAITGTLSLGQSVRAVYLRVPTGTATVGIKDPILTQDTTTCNLTTSWQRFTLTETTPPSGGFVAGIWIFNIPASGIEVWGADLRVANDGINLPSYQRVNTSTDYDTVGFKTYLRFNGVSQWLQTNSIDFTYSDKMFVCAGVRKLSDAATGLLTEFSASTATNAGSFFVALPIASTASYRFESKGTVISSASSLFAAYPAPITNVLTGIGNISGDQAILRVNGTQVAISTSDQGTGNYGNYPLYIGARAGTSLFFNGRLYQLVIAAGSEIRLAEEDSDLFLSESGDFITAETTVAVIQSAIEQTEAFVNRKTSAF